MQLGRQTFVKQSARLHSARTIKPLTVTPAASAGKQETSSAALLADVQVSFQIPYRVKFGQQLCITGGCDTLGSWGPNNAVTMEWTEGDVWVTACQLPKGSTIDYKYIIKTQSNSQVVWQGGDNMVIELADAAGALEVQDSWDGREHVIVAAAASGSPITSASSVDELLLAAGSSPIDSSLLPSVSLPASANADALANDLLVKAMDEELVKTSIESMSLEKIKEMMTQHGLPPSGRKEQMVDQLKQQLSKNGVASSKA